MQLENQNEFSYTLIQNQEILERSMLKISTASWVAIDTEFIPENRYRPLLCIIQIASQEENFIIDCKYVHDLSPFFLILQNEKIVKITHAGKNDYEIFFEQYGILPLNVFDTQIANSFVNGSLKASLAFLLSQILNIEISKDERNSDWWERPLTDNQILYALNDVIHLKPLVVSLIGKLKGVNRLNWFLEECKKMETRDYYKSSYIDQLTKYHWVRKLPVEDLAFLMKILEWRDRTAKKRDMPASSLLSFPDVRQIMGYVNKTLDPMNEKELEIDEDLRKILPLMYTLCTEVSEDDIKAADSIQRKYPPIESDNSKFQIRLDLLKLYLEYVAEKINLPMKMLLDTRPMKEHLSNNTLEASPLGSGWRAKLISPAFLSWLNSIETFEMNFIEKEGIMQINSVH